MKQILIISLFAIIITSCLDGNTQNVFSQKKEIELDKYEVATLAGGCFWCIEAPVEALDGVIEVISGYAGGSISNPTYEQVISGKTGHREAVQIYFDNNIISYSEILDVYWKLFDPTDKGGSFNDRGPLYESAIFYHDDVQRKIAENSKRVIEMAEIFNKPIVTEIIIFTNFYPAEEYHQNYYEKNPIHYNNYKVGSGREDFIRGVWGDDKLEFYISNEKNEMIKQNLTEIQFRVTQESATERPFENEYWNNKNHGIYVDIVSGEPLFSSKDQIDCGSGWPSFSKPIDTRYLKKMGDNSHGMKRTEVRSKIADSHLGHVFNDGPEPTNLRYCINSASLRFIPRDMMEEFGYAEYIWLVDHN